MAGIKALRRISLGQESTGTPGTAVAATTTLLFGGVMEDQREVVFPEINTGYISGVDYNYTPKYMAALTMEGDATFEQLGYILGAGVKDSTGTTDSGSGTGFIYSYTLPTSAQNVPFFYTIEAGDDNEAEEMEYSFVKEFTLSGNAGESWQVSANWVGRQCTTTTFTPSTDAPVPATLPEVMLFSKSKLYIDSCASSDTVGTTIKSNTLLAAELKVTTGFQEVFAADGYLYFSFVKQVAPEVILTITFEHDGTATAEKAFWRSGTARQIRILCEGSALAGAGAYTYKTMKIDLAGKWEKFDKLDEQDGNDIIKATFRARYNTTVGLFGNIVIVNELSSLP